MSALAAPAAPAARAPDRRPSSPPASRSRAGCPSATTASRCATSRTPPTRKFLLCPDDWRRHYLKGERTPPSGAMFLGAPRRRRPLHLLPPPARARRTAHARPAPRRLPRPLDARARRRAGQARRALGRRARRAARLHDRPARRSTLTLAELVPRLGRPVAVQRELEYALAPGLEWTIQGFLDLETLRADDDGGELVPAIVDYKVKNTLHSQAKADHDPQAGLYLAGRWLAGAARRALLLRADRQARQAAQDDEHRASSSPAAPSAQLRATLARIAQAASQIAALYERYGPDEPWGFADPSGWKCSPALLRAPRALPGRRRAVTPRRAVERPVADQRAAP